MTHLLERFKTLEARKEQLSKDYLDFNADILKAAEEQGIKKDAEIDGDNIAIVEWGLKDYQRLKSNGMLTVTYFTRKAREWKAYEIK